MSSSRRWWAVTACIVLGACGRCDASVRVGTAGGRAETKEREPAKPDASLELPAWGDDDTPTQCTDKPLMVQAVMSTVVAEFCHGFVQWDVVEGFQLNEVRYGTIVEVDVMGSEPLAESLRVGKDVWVKTRRVTAVVRAVVKGRLARSRRGAEVQFVVADTDAWAALHGAREMPLRGAVFLPTPSVATPAQLGCLEGHFLPWDPQYARDVRHFVAARRGRDDTEPFDREQAFEMAQNGGFAAGTLISEYAPLDVALSLVNTPTSSELSAFQLGLVSGLWRMRTITYVENYPRRWSKPQLEHVIATMGRWAIAGLALPAEPHSARSWLLDASSNFAHVAELGVPAPTRHALARRMPKLAHWLLGGRIEPRETRPRDWLMFADRPRRECDDGGPPSPSHKYAERGY